MSDEQENLERRCSVCGERLVDEHVNPLVEKVISPVLRIPIWSALKSVFLGKVCPKCGIRYIK